MNTYTISLDTDDGRPGIKGVSANLEYQQWQMIFDFLAGRIGLQPIDYSAQAKQPEPVKEAEE